MGKAGLGRYGDSLVIDKLSTNDLLLHDQVIVEVGAASAMLGEACHARMALAILANASEVTPSRISEEDVGAKLMV